MFTFLMHIGIAIRHAMAVGLHIWDVEKVHSKCDSPDLSQARSIAWAGIWMLEKYV